MTTKNAIESPPTQFNLAPHQERWFRWQEINDCFWGGRHANELNPQLAPIRKFGGLYVMALGDQSPARIHPDVAEVHYVGETNRFQARMSQFGTSAGYWGEQKNGHSAGWRANAKGTKERLWIAFFLLGGDLPPHLAKALRVWMEALAIEEHCQSNGQFPIWNNAHNLKKPRK